MKFTVGDVEIFATTGGRPFQPELPGIVFLHGAGMDRTVWALQTRYFAHHGFSVVAVDLPGHGLSGGEPRESIEAWAGWIPELIEALGIKEVSLVGHSMGSLIALEGAARFPDRIKRLALLGTALRMPVHPDLLQAAQENLPLASELIASWGHGRVGHLGGTAVPGMSLIGGGVSLLSTGTPGVLGQDLAVCNAYGGGKEAAAKVSCPTLCLLGAEDRMTPAREGKKLADALAGSELSVLSGAGHMMMLEAPDATLDALRQWFS